MSFLLLDAPSAHARLDAIQQALRTSDPSAELQIVAPSREAARALLLGLTQSRGALFGWAPRSLRAWVIEQSLPLLAARGWSLASPVALEAAARDAIARTLDRAPGSGDALDAIQHEYRQLKSSPGVATALRRTLLDLRLARASANDLPPLLASLLDAYLASLRERKLADWADALQLAQSAPPPKPWLALDLPIDDRASFELFAARRETLLLACTPPCSSALWQALSEGKDAAAIARPWARANDFVDAPQDALRHALQVQGLNVRGVEAPSRAAEVRQAVRSLCAQLAEGARADQLAILLPKPEHYRGMLRSELARAGVPSHFSQESRSPNPRGRALLSLLRFKLEAYSASAFSEFLAFGVAQAVATPARGDAAWWAPDPDLVGVRPPEHAPTDTPDEGALRLSTRFERKIVDAAVIGGRDRWKRRLDALDRSIAQTLDDPWLLESQRLSLLEERAELARLRAFVLELILLLDTFPPRASGERWAQLLGELSARAIVDPERIQAIVSSLSALQMEASLEQIHAWLHHPLSTHWTPKPRPPGAIWIGTPAELAGRSFASAIVLGVRDGEFPAPFEPDPLLPSDTQSSDIQSSDSDPNDSDLEAEGAPRPQNAWLPTRERAREAHHAAALRAAFLALHCAPQLLLTWPAKVGATHAFPSAIALTALTQSPSELAEEGLASLRERAVLACDETPFWPAPSQPDRAAHREDFILSHWTSSAQNASEFAYIVDKFPFVARNLRRLAMRSRARYSHLEGLVSHPDFPVERQSLSGDQAAGSGPLIFSPSRLETFASCPMRYALHARAKLKERLVPSALDQLDPRSRGLLAHSVQFRLLSQLRDEKLLDRLAEPQVQLRARELLRDTLNALAPTYRELLAPAVESSWQRGLRRLHKRLLDWLNEILDEEEWRPTFFELSFGLPPRGDRDPRSVASPVTIQGGLTLRGSIDLVERKLRGAKTALRVSDLKTGRPPTGKQLSQRPLIAGGQHLQPALYAAALRELAPALLGEEERGADLEIEARLVYLVGRNVTFGDKTQEGIARLQEALDEAHRQGRFPAAPTQGACQHCDYRRVCGDIDRAQKSPGEALSKLRSHS